MSAKEFWEDDPQLFVSFRTSFINKKKREMEEIDFKCWRQGLYVYDGVGKLMLSLKQMIGNILSNTKDNSKIDTYPIKPYNELENDKKIENQLRTKKLKNKDYQNSLIFFGSMKQRYLDKIKENKL